MIGRNRLHRHSPAVPRESSRARILLDQFGSRIPAQHRDPGVAGKGTGRRCRDCLRPIGHVHERDGALAHQFADRRNDHLLDGIRCLRVPALLPCIPLFASEVFRVCRGWFGFLLQARVYKWYIWLIPMAILWVWHRYFELPPAAADACCSSPKGSAWWALAGCTGPTSGRPSYSCVSSSWASMEARRVTTMIALASCVLWGSFYHRASRSFLSFGLAIWSLESDLLLR